MQSKNGRRNCYYRGIPYRQPKRVIKKCGLRNIGVRHNNPKDSLRFYQDFFNTVVDAKWRYVIALFSFSFFGTWFGFAALWYLISYSHGDFSFDPVTGIALSDTPRTCLQGVDNWVGAILMSIETQTSIGFGERFPGEECPEAVFLMAAQIVVAYAIEGAMIGIVYAKMIRPARRAHELKFSRRAVICHRDSQPCLVFRVSDSNAQHIMNTTVEAFLYEDPVNADEVHHDHVQPIETPLKLENQGKMLLIFPTTVCHVIDETSPLYNLSQQNLSERKFEIAVTMTGSSQSTGQLSQSRSSYLSREIVWGRRFVNINHYDDFNETYVADYSCFEQTEAVETPPYSARQLDEILNDTREFLSLQAAVVSDFDPEHLNFIGADGMILNRDDSAMDDEVAAASICSEQYFRKVGDCGGDASVDDCLMNSWASSFKSDKRNPVQDPIKTQMDRLVEELENNLSESSLDLLREIQLERRARQSVS